MDGVGLAKLAKGDRQIGNTNATERHRMHARALLAPQQFRNSSFALVLSSAV
jgi:hypothetical protein